MPWLKGGGPTPGFEFHPLRGLAIGAPIPGGRHAILSRAHVVAWCELQLPPEPEVVHGSSSSTLD
eukprot:9113081-Prorocentrum_lima.AAC.1